MKRSFILWVASLGVLSALATGPASAQTPASRPPVSPYLNLLRRGASPGGNYYDLVRPQVDFRSSIQQLQQQVTGQQQAVAAAETTTELPATGHRTGFQSHTRYFLNNFSGGVGAGGGVSTGGTSFRPAAAAAGRPAATPSYGGPRGGR